MILMLAFSSERFDAGRWLVRTSVCTIVNLKGEGIIPSMNEVLAILVMSGISS